MPGLFLPFFLFFVAVVKKKKHWSFFSAIIRLQLNKILEIHLPNNPIQSILYLNNTVSKPKLTATTANNSSSSYS